MYPSRAFLLVAFLIVGTSVSAQEAMQSQATEEHRVLKMFVGTWHSKFKSTGGEGIPAMEHTGKGTYRMIGDLWIVADMETTAGEMTMHAVQTIGYDPAKKKYVGTWVDSMMNYMWKYEGTYDKATKTFDLIAEGPDFVNPGKTRMYKDSYRFKDENTMLAVSAMQDDDGEWDVFMQGEVKKVK